MIGLPLGGRLPRVQTSPHAQNLSLAQPSRGARFAA